MALVGALLLINLTTPHMVGPLGVLAFFVLIYIVGACTLYVVLEVMVIVLRRTLPPGKWLLAVEGVSQTKLYYYTSVLALFPVILLGMQSVGEVRLAEIGLLGLFVGLGCFFVSRRF